MIESWPVTAPACPPETGASPTPQPPALAPPAISRPTPPPFPAGDGLTQRIGRARPVSLRPIPPLSGRTVEPDHVMAGRNQMSGHGRAHDAQPDEGDFH